MEILQVVILSLLVSFLVACGGGESASEPSVTVSMTVGQLPSHVTINRADMIVGDPEYQWAVTFDIDRDNGLSAGDIVLEFGHRRTATDLQTIETNQLDNALLAYSSDFEYERLSGELEVNVTGNTIILKARKSLHQALSNISSTTFYRFQTIAYAGDNTQHIDSYPEKLPLYIPIGNGKYTATVDSELMQSVDLREVAIIID